MTDKITTLTHTASGASCRVHAHGATVLGFCSADKREHLFLSSQAKLDGSKAIRGGIPICFPIFGPPKLAESTMPQHGFARVNEWTLVKTFDEEAAAGATYTLNLADAKAGRGTNNPWCPEQCEQDGTDCKLTYELRLEAKQLTCTLLVDNTGTSSFDFQALLHNYFGVENKAATDHAKTYVHGLGGYMMEDKVLGHKKDHVQSYDEDVVIEGETDHVYLHPEDHPVVHAVVATGNETTNMRIEAAGQVDENVATVSCVVWNPGPTKATAMSDFGDEEYHDMICVEPGLIGHQALLPPGKQARFTQSLIVVPK